MYHAQVIFSSASGRQYMLSSRSGVYTTRSLVLGPAHFKPVRHYALSHVQARAPHAVRTRTPSFTLEATHRKSRPWSTKGMSWNKVLENYARSSNPLKDLPSNVILLANDQCITIFDGYEKAKFHFLVLRRSSRPRMPSFNLDPTDVPDCQLETLSDCQQGHKYAVHTCTHCRPCARPNELWRFSKPLKLKLNV